MGDFQEKRRRGVVEINVEQINDHVRRIGLLFSSSYVNRFEISISIFPELVFPRWDTSRMLRPCLHCPLGRTI